MPASKVDKFSAGRTTCRSPMYRVIHNISLKVKA